MKSFTLLIISAVLLGYVKIVEHKVNAERLTPDIGEKVPMSNAQIAEKGPNIPSAKQTYENDNTIGIHYNQQ